MASGILCQSCGIEAPTRQACFFQNIGMLVMRKQRKISGLLCKKCIHRHFWKMTTTTLFLGPWGYISVVVSPIFIVSNVFNYVRASTMPSVPAGAGVPVLTNEALAQLEPYTVNIFDRINAKEPLKTVAIDVAAKARVTPGQVVKYVIELSRPTPVQPPTGGFPVTPLPASVAPGAQSVAAVIAQQSRR